MKVYAFRKVLCSTCLIYAELHCIGAKDVAKERIIRWASVEGSVRVLTSWAWSHNTTYHSNLAVTSKLNSQQAVYRSTGCGYTFGWKIVQNPGAGCVEVLWRLFHGSVGWRCFPECVIWITTYCTGCITFCSLFISVMLVRSVRVLVVIHLWTKKFW